MERSARAGLPVLCLAAGAAAVTVFLASPDDSVLQVVAWFVPVVVAVVMTATRAHRASGAVRRSLLLLLLAELGYLCVSVVWYPVPLARGVPLPFPSPVDAGYFLVYGAYAVFLVNLLRSQSGGRDIEARVAVIDALILTTALSAVLWVGVVLPNLDAQVSGSATVVALLYPTCNLLLCGLGARLALDRLSRSGPAGLLLLGWLATEITGDVVYGVQSADGTFEYASPLLVTWMVGHTCLAAMVCHPSAPLLLSSDARDTGEVSSARFWRLPLFRRGRLIVLYLAAVVPLVMEALSDGRSAVLLLMAAGGFALVIWRLALLAGDLREQRRLAAELEIKGAELLQANRDLRDADEARSVFLATMSHEIRTPLNAIIGMSGIVLDSPLTAQQAEQLEIVRGAGESLLALVNDILDFSKIDAGKIDLETTPFVVLECVESAVDLVAPQAAAKDLELLHTVAPDCPDVVVGDLTRVRQVLVNLLSNAVKFTAAGEVVLEVSPDDGSGGLRFAVRDTGIGIPADRMDRIFESFTQADTSTTRSAGGTGLGLTISRQLAEAMGGRVWAESRPGAGSTFFFTVPLRPARRPVTDDTASTMDDLAGSRVLVVDDNDSHRRILRHQLEAWGLVTTDTASPETALEWVHRGRPFDLAVIDVNMPVMDGVTLARLLRTTRQGRDLPLVLLSTLGTRRGPWPDLSHVAHVTKPVKTAALAEALVSAVRDAPVSLEAAADDGASDDVLARLRVLVAEDNVVNQKVALAVLQRFGCRADVAANGLEALQATHRQDYDVVLMDVQMPEMDGLEATLQATHRQDYDVVLMDVQMPEMDGLEATRHIRAELPADRQPYIVALTANALAEDRDRCLAAGMDAYLSKPLRAAQLVGLLSGRPTGPAAPLHRPEPTPDPVGQAVLDPTVLEDLRADLGDDEFFHEMIDRFATNSVSQVDQMRVALRAGDSEGLRTLAHTLKGTAANFGAHRVMQLALELQGAAHALGGDAAPRLVTSLSSEVAQAGEALRCYQVDIRT